MMVAGIYSAIITLLVRVQFAI